MSSDEPTDPQESQPISFERVLAILREGDIVEEHGLMRWSSNYTFMISVREGDFDLPAVYKPHKGERPLWDFPDGMLCQRELASFLTSEALGWRIIPPTALRDGPHGLGSVQFFIDHDPEENYFTFGDSVVDQAMRICVFDVLVNNADRKGGHCLLDAGGHVWGIDHGITFHSQPKLRTVIWDFAGEPIPTELLDSVEALCGTLEDARSELRQELASLITHREIHAFQQRVRNLLRARTFPQAGPGGPHYPWPPV